LRLGQKEAAVLTMGAEYGDISKRVIAAITYYPDEEIINWQGIDHREGTVITTYAAPEEMHRRMKRLAAVKGVFLMDLINECIRRYYKRDFLALDDDEDSDEGEDGVTGS
jgi:hypothetical protein